MAGGGQMAGSLDRRAFLGATLGSAATWTAACSDAPKASAFNPGAAQWVGTTPERGHRLRSLKSGGLPAAAVRRRTQVLIVGAGIAGLAAARAFMQRGVTDLHVLELEDQPGGNSRAHTLGGLACPIGAHYLPLPGKATHEVSDWLHELGLLRQVLGRTVADERHLCHSPQERLYIDGAWADGLLPPAEPGSATAQQYQQFASAVASAQRDAGFAMPSHRAPWGSAQQALDAVTFSQWLGEQGLMDERLRWYLDYCCRDDYGAAAEVVSAWAGLHYFASRHGFQAPGEAEAEREPVFTWPEGNAWLMQRLAAPLGERLVTARTALQLEVGKHGVEITAWNEATGQIESWQAQTCVLAVPLFIAARLLRSAPPPALPDIVARQTHAPWLVANLHIREPLLQRQGAPAAWDSVEYGSTALGYVDATHQALHPVPGATVLTAYHALPVVERAALLQGDASHWAQRVLQTLTPLHPDLPAKLAHMALTRHGHAMAIPTPGMRGHPALAALRAQRGRLRFAHADLAAYSVFEEAFTVGAEVALASVAG